MIGHDNFHNKDFVGFIELNNTKYVNLDSDLYREYVGNVCKNCDIYFQTSSYIYKYRETYRDIFLVHPELAIEFINSVGLKKIVDDLYNIQERKLNVFFVYSSLELITAKQLVDGLMKWNEYEKFISNLTNYSSYFQNNIQDAANYIYNTYGKCKDFSIENICKKNLDVFTHNKIECHHNDLAFLALLDEFPSDFLIYDLDTENALSLPNIYSDATVCWGTGNGRPKNLITAFDQYWSTPFNGDLLLDSTESTDETISGYGFDESDFYPYDEYHDVVDWDASPRSFTVREIVKIINQGGDNRYKGEMDVTSVEFDISGVKEILQIVNGQILSDFSEVIDKSFLDFLDASDDVFLFLINDLDDGNWQAYLPTNVNEGIYIEINLNDLLKLEDENDDD